MPVVLSRRLILKYIVCKTSLKALFGILFDSQFDKLNGDTKISFTMKRVRCENGARARSSRLIYSARRAVGSALTITMR